MPAWLAASGTTAHSSINSAAASAVRTSRSWGAVTVPAGTFKAYKLVWTNNLGEVETRWASPSDAIATVKRHVERPSTHPQGAGVLDAELLSVVLPGK